MVKGAYKARNPKASALYQCVSTHFTEFEAVYPTRFQEQFGFYRPVIRRVIEKFLGCGDLTGGFARVRCDQCRHEYLLAFSCKGRYSCPSCHQKRVLQFGAWVSDEVLAPVPHRQYVFTVPKILRVYFRKDRRLLGKLSQCADDALKTVYRKAIRDSKAVPGVIISIQTFGDMVNFHPHLHALVTDGVFGPNGWFYAFPRIDLRVLEALFRHRVLRMLLQERRIDEALVRKLLSWRHSGFSVHNDVKIPAQDREGRRTVAEYILRSPFALDKLRYHAKTGTIIYRSKMHPVLKRNFEVFSALDWLAALTAHIPNHGEHLVRYYGWYSNVSRGKRKKAQPDGTTAAAQGVVEVELPTPGRAAKQEWARLIKQVYEADPLLGPRCGGAMRIIAARLRSRRSLHRATGGHREDPDPPRVVSRPEPAEGACSGPQPPSRGPGADFAATSRRRIAPHPTGAVRRGPPPVTPRPTPTPSASAASPPPGHLSVDTISQRAVYCHPCGGGRIPAEVVRVALLLWADPE